MKLSGLCAFSIYQHEQDTPGLGWLPQPGVYGQRGLWKGRAPHKPPDQKLGRESCDVGHTEGHVKGELPERCQRDYSIRVDNIDQ